MPEVEQPKPEGPFLFKVNGVEIKADSRVLPARAILELAAEHHAMPGKPSDYALQGDKGLYRPDDPVDLLEDDVFITIPNTPTPVA